MFQYLGLTLFVFFLTWFLVEESASKTTNLESILVHKKALFDHKKKMDNVLPLIKKNQTFLEKNGQGWFMEHDGLIRHGMVLNYTSNNELVKTPYHYGQMHGIQSVYFHDSDHLKSTTEYRNSRKDGHECFYDKNGYIVQKNLYALGKIVQEIRYGINGPVSEKNFNLQGDKHGNQITFYPDGSIESCYSYRNDKLDGECFANYENGKTWYHVPYKNGKPVNRYVEYFESGKLKKQEMYGSDTNHMIEYFESGTVEYAGCHKGGIRHGQGIQFVDAFGKENELPFRHVGEFSMGVPLC